jgi:hypothetical protein
MKPIAILEVEQARGVMECLKKASIPSEIRTKKEVSGLEMSEITVPDIYYDRGCGIAEKWQADERSKPKKNDLSLDDKNMPKDREREIEGIIKRRRFGILIFLAISFLAFLAMFFLSVIKLKSGSDIMDANIYNQPVGPWLRLVMCAIILPSILVMMWQTVRRNRIPKNRRD